MEEDLGVPLRAASTSLMSFGAADHDGIINMHTVEALVVIGG
jgi:hypothetical protein